MAKTLNVLVIGGGIGGLCLAQGLTQDGVRVAVYERDRTPTDRTQGYRIHINQDGSRALHERLPSGAWEAFVATVGTPSTGLGFLTDRMRELIFIAQPPAPDPASGEYPVSRVMLRQILLSGLGDVVHFGKEFLRYERGEDDTITAFFADGMTASGDVLVGADGIHSKVRQQYLPHAAIVDTGAVAVSGKFWLTERTRDHVPPQLTMRLNNVLPPSGCGMFLAPYINRPDGPSAALPDGDLADHLFWAFIARRDAYGRKDDLHRLDGTGLQRLMVQIVRDWHPTLKRLVAEADPDTMFTTPIQTSTPVAPWETTTVTLLGDAIHAMTPLQGLGGNTALRDASLLCRQLITVDRGEAVLRAAIRDYEAAMRDYSAGAVRASLQATEYAISESRMARSIFKTVLRVADALPPLKHRMFPQ